ncbi:MAG: peptidylprolyl isomerase [Fibrobacter sp.]|nr:peptidylprolyl isomerase [Fibrobacter sp.]MBQ5465019.1 peptidylprolyl isomerase [Fibrobacter sp.]
MLTWINEKAKWVIVIFAAGIAIGLLAMDRVPNQGHSYPIGVVNDRKISYTEFDSRVKMVMQNQYQNQHLEDEQYSQLRSQVFSSFVRQALFAEQFEKAELTASVAELKDAFKRNSDAVRARLVQEAQARLYAIQQQATSQEDLMQRSQAYIASLPKFLTDTTFNKADYDAWIETPAAYRWSAMLMLEDEMKNNTIPSRQLQALVGASVHPTSLEAKWSVERRMTDYELQVAVAPNSAFVVDSNSVDSVMVSGYFKAHALDSFFVKKDMAQFQYVSIPVEATAADDASIREYAMTLYYQLTDSSSATTFEDMARVSSEDPGSAEKGGVLSEDFVGRGTYVKSFEDVAFALDSGKISEPVRSQYGYHIIKSYGNVKNDKGEVEKVKVGHILLTVTASSNTIDSLEKILTSIKKDVDAGSDLVTEANARGLDVKTSEWVAREDNISAMGFLRGLTSFAWPNENLPDEESEISNVLKNNKWVAIAKKVGTFKAGERSLPLYYKDIKEALLKQKAGKAAEIYLNSVAAQVKAWNPADSTAKIDKIDLETKNASVDGFVPGFGYGDPLIAKVVTKAKVGEWTAPVVAENGAVMVKVVSKKTPKVEDVEEAIKQDVDNAYRFGIMTAFNDYVTTLEASTLVKSNLDLYYRD